MAKLDIFYGALIGGIAVVFFALTSSFPSVQRGLDPRVFPRFVSICTFILSMVLIGKGVKALVKEQAGTERTTRERLLDRPAVLKRIIWLFLIGLGYVLIIEKVGYVISTPFLIAATMVLFGEKRFLRILLVSVLTTGVLFVLFRMIFRVPLPVSIF